MNELLALRIHAPGVARRNARGFTATPGRGLPRPAPDRVDRRRHGARRPRRGPEDVLTELRAGARRPHRSSARRRGDRAHPSSGRTSGDTALAMLFYGGIAWASSSSPGRAPARPPR